MKACTHLKRFDIDAPEASRPACVLCSDCLDIAAKSIRLHLKLMWDAEDNTAPDLESSLRILLHDLTGERPKKPRRDITTYNREYQRRRRAKLGAA